ncbi:uncharacterized protein EAF02_007701 [Botrytis sinoallii]|uniref:uncharacterized protein n=1 Tax=Botrytis sinoallii TaxID=1463999 RepID=UPI0019007AD7|nr:uncharacterized protein EAF02_007701 [Botrytis sinoallii]KAF7880064.1 hypothetical protein EAF02_007701 [Botrytis sinoallii]
MLSNNFKIFLVPNNEIFRSPFAPPEAHQKPRQEICIYCTLQFDGEINNQRTHNKNLFASAAAEDSTYFTRHANTDEAHRRRKMRCRVNNRMVTNNRGSFLEYIPCYTERARRDSLSMKTYLRSHKPTALTGATPSRLKTLESNVYLPILCDTLQKTCNNKAWCLCGWEVPGTRNNTGGMSEAPEAGPSKRGFNISSFCGCLELPEPVRTAYKNAILKMSPVTPTNYSFDGYNMIFNASPTTPTSYSAGDHHGSKTPIHFSLYLFE